MNDINEKSATCAKCGDSEDAARHDSLMLPYDYHAFAPAPPPSATCEDCGGSGLLRDPETNNGYACPSCAPPPNATCAASFREGPRWDVPGHCELPVGHYGPHSDVAHNRPPPSADGEAGKVLTREEFRETLRKAENAAHDFGSLTNVNDHRHTVRLWNHDAALRAEVDFRAVTIEGLLKQRDEAEAEVERLRTGWDALRERIVALTEGDDSLKARADALAVERDGAVRRGLMILDQKEHFRIKADALAVEVERLVKMLAEQDDEADAAVARVAELTRERDEATLAGRIAECDAVAAWLIAERRSDFPEVELLHMLELRQNEARHAKEKA